MGKPMTYARILLGVIGLLAISPLTPNTLSQRLNAEETGDADNGREIARTWCSNCHIVGSEQQSGSSNGAPPFVAIADMKSTTSSALHAFLETPHERMPDLHLDRGEVDDLAAYIISLRRTPGH
jgi:mono/diheme cytochrome c family protein